jgi:hypothetical protein
MMVKNVLAVLSVAAVTMAFTLATLGPRWAGAEGQSLEIKPTIVRPEMTSAGCRFSLSTDKETYAAGEPLVLLVEAHNPTDKPVETTVWATVSTPPPMSQTLMISRVAPKPTVPWSGQCKVNLAPGETRTVELKTGINATPLGSMTITLSDKLQEVIVGNAMVQDANFQLNTAQQAMPLQQLVQPQ